MEEETYETSYYAFVGSGIDADDLCGCCAPGSGGIQSLSHLANGWRRGHGLTYKWYYKNKGANNFVLSSITGSTYSVAMNSSRNGRQLYCVVKDRYGNAVGSDVVVIKMK